MNEKLWKKRKGILKREEIANKKNFSNSNLNMNANIEMAKMSLAVQDPSGPFGDG